MKLLADFLTTHLDVIPFIKNKFTKLFLINSIIAPVGIDHLFSGNTLLEDKEKTPQADEVQTFLECEKLHAVEFKRSAAPVNVYSLKGYKGTPL